MASSSDLADARGTRQPAAPKVTFSALLTIHASLCALRWTTSTANRKLYFMSA
jgi:hypothetical protein